MQLFISNFHSMFHAITGEKGENFKFKMTGMFQQFTVLLHPRVYVHFELLHFSVYCFITPSSLCSF